MIFRKKNNANFVVSLDVFLFEFCKPWNSVFAEFCALN